MKVLVSGASGLIGRRVVAGLEGDGRHVIRLVRRAARAGEAAWDPPRPPDPAIFHGIDAVIHLAGENIGERWTEEKKRRIYESRVPATRSLVQAMLAAPVKPKALISASAIGIYGNRGDEILDEGSPPADDFLARLARDWEDATVPAEHAGIRTVLLRTGVVLAREGGALAQMLTPFRMGLGGRVGSGKQWMSWVTIDDVAAIVRFVLDAPGLRGPINVVAPNPVVNADFARTLGKVLRRPAISPLPAFLVRALFGEMGETLLLGSARVRPRRLEKSGYRFHQPSLEAALRHLLGRPR